MDSGAVDGCHIYLVYFFFFFRIFGPTYWQTACNQNKINNGINNRQIKMNSKSTLSTNTTQMKVNNQSETKHEGFMAKSYLKHHNPILNTGRPNWGLSLNQNISILVCSYFTYFILYYFVFSLDNKGIKTWHWYRAPLQNRTLLYS